MDQFQDGNGRLTRCRCLPRHGLTRPRGCRRRSCPVPRSQPADPPAPAPATSLRAAIGAPCTQCPRHRDPIHARKGLTCTADGSSLVAPLCVRARSSSSGRNVAHTQAAGSHAPPSEQSWAGGVAGASGGRQSSCVREVAGAGGEASPPRQSSSAHALPAGLRAAASDHPGASLSSSCRRCLRLRRCPRPGGVAACPLVAAMEMGVPPVPAAALAAAPVVAAAAALVAAPVVAVVAAVACPSVAAKEAAKGRVPPLAVAVCRSALPSRLRGPLRTLRAQLRAERQLRC
jgi:hypothetical protein